MIRWVAPLLLAAGPAVGADCSRFATQVDMNDCAFRAYKDADAELNRTYGDVVRRLRASPAAAKQLTAAQRAWVGFRDAECTFVESGVAGGSVAPMVFSQCLEQRTRERTTVLRRFLSCPEGDLACPLPPP